MGKHKRKKQGENGFSGPGKGGPLRERAEPKERKEDCQRIKTAKYKMPVTRASYRSVLRPGTPHGRLCRI